MFTISFVHCQLVNIGLTLYKNGDVIVKTFAIRHCSSLAFTLESTQDTCPAIVYQAPKFPVSRLYLEVSVIYYSIIIILFFIIIIIIIIISCIYGS